MTMLGIQRPGRPVTRRLAMGVAAVAAAFTLALAPVSAQAQKTLTVGNPFSPLSLDPSLSGNGRAGREAAVPRAKFETMQFKGKALDAEARVHQGGISAALSKLGIGSGKTPDSRRTTRSMRQPMFAA